MMFSLLDPRTWLAAMAAIAIATGLGYWRGNTAGAAAVQARWNSDTTKQQLASATAALQAEEKNRKTEQDLRHAAEQNAAQIATDLAAARRQRADADAAGQRLRKQVAQLVATATHRVSADSSASTTGATNPAAADAIDLLADLYGRADTAAGELAAAADEARIRGLACERQYAAVTAPSGH